MKVFFGIDNQRYFTISMLLWYTRLYLSNAYVMRSSAKVILMVRSSPNIGLFNSPWRPSSALLLTVQPVFRTDF